MDILKVENNFWRGNDTGNCSLHPPLPFTLRMGSINTTNIKNRTVKVQIEEGHSQTYIEIPLQRNGYFWGYARDSARESFAWNNGMGGRKAWIKGEIVMSPPDQKWILL